MKIKIITFGKIKNNELGELFEYYKKLAGKYFSLEYVVLKDIKDRAISFSDIEKYLSTDTYLLSEHGKESTTLEFSNLLSTAKLNSHELTFIIGNAFGFENIVKSKFQLLSLSKMTFPHEMAIVMLLEQIFRAGDILAGGKYSK